MQIVQLHELVEIKAGYPFRRKVPEVVGGGTYAIQMKDVYIDDGIDWADVVETELSVVRTMNLLSPGDILFAFRGNHNYAVLVDELANTYQAVASPHFFVLRCCSEKILPAYLTWWLNRAPLQEYFGKESTGSLTKGLRKSAVAEACIALPSLEKQQIIVNFANTAKRERQLLEKMISNNESLLDGIANNLLSGELK